MQERALECLRCQLEQFQNEAQSYSTNVPVYVYEFHVNS